MMTYYTIFRQILLVFCLAKKIKFYIIRKSYHILIIMPRLLHLNPVENISTWIQPRLPKKSPSSTHLCEIYRETEWGKYCDTYHNLLACQSDISHTQDDLLSTGFINQDGTNYISELPSRFQLEDIVKQCIVSTPRMIWIPCMDERIQYLTASHQALSLGMPGCECLMSTQEKLHIIDNIVRICQQNPSIEEIVVSSHSGCGAVKYAINQHKKSHKWGQKIHQKLQTHSHIIDRQSIKYAKTFAQLLETTFQEKNLSIAVRTHHISQKEIHSQNLHNAFGAIINFNPLLNSAELEERIGLPMFNIYAEGQNTKQIIENIELAIEIASGNTGFSQQYLNSKNPFIILFTAQLDNQHRKKIEKIIQNLIKKTLNINIIYKILEA